MSLIEVYKSLLAVLEEVGGGGDRAEKVIKAVAEGLMRVSYARCKLSAELIGSLANR